MFEDKAISFNKAGYDPFIDFIKAYAIICVLIGHTLPFPDYWGYGLWAGMQVPLFVLVQAFHSFKKDNPVVNLEKIFLRVVLPYILVQSIAILFLLCNGSINVNSVLLDGGIGPGSYYPWVFIQVAVLLPFVKKWLDKNYDKKLKVLISFLIICESFEILFSVIDLQDDVYRLLAIRYLFLFYFAWIWIMDGIIINWKTTILSLLSFIAIIYFEYLSVDDEVLFYKTGWKFHRWPCYYFVAVWGVYLLRKLFEVLQKKAYIMKSINILAKCSYEIFLIQMLIISFYPSNFIFDYFIVNIVDNHIVAVFMQLLLRVFIVFTMSIFLGYYFNLYYNLIVNRIVNK